jgi:hypothetical protein
MIKKIRENKVNKHSIIKALNKLYKRAIPINEQGSAPILSTLESNDTVAEPESLNVEETPQVDEQDNRIDYSQSPMDKQ